MTVEDAQGCLVDTSIRVAAIQVFDIEFGIFQPNCSNNDDGVINVNLIRSGQAPLTFDWNNGSSNQSLVSIGAGDYQLTITDGTGCSYVSDTIQMEAPLPFNLVVDAVGTIDCFGDSTGFIELTLEGGMEPYSIIWPSLGVQTDDVYNLEAGNYRVIIRDGNNCPIDTTFTLEQPPLLTAETEIEVAGVCEESIANRLIGSATGGVAPYSYTWNNGQNGPIIDQPETGDYNLFVEDSQGCVDSVVS